MDFPLAIHPLPLYLVIWRLIGLYVLKHTVLLMVIPSFLEWILFFRVPRNNQLYPILAMSRSIVTWKILMLRLSGLLIYYVSFTYDHMIDLQFYVTIVSIVISFPLFSSLGVKLVYYTGWLKKIIYEDINFKYFF